VTTTRVALADLESLVGQELGPGEPLVVSQERIDEFAHATDDEQWIHVDVDRAASGPYGTTIAHGYLVLSLVPTLTRALLEIDGVGRRVNYGVNRVRFPAPARSGATLRATLTPRAVETTADGAVQLTTVAAVRADGQDKPCCVVESIVRCYP
jgi:acyl dehydratase